MRAPIQDYAAIANVLGVTHSFPLCQALVQALRPCAGTMLLDVGAGTCGDASWIAQSTGARIFCVDTSLEMLGRSPGNVTCVLADAYHLPVATGALDGAYAVNLLQLIDSPEVLLREVRRVLCRSGRIALPVTSQEQLATRFLNRFFPNLEAVERQRFRPASTILQLLSETGFQSLTQTEVNLGWFTVDHDYVRRIRSGIFSGLGLLRDDERASGLSQLDEWVCRSEASGSWHREQRFRTMIVAEAA